MVFKTDRKDFRAFNLDELWQIFKQSGDTSAKTEILLRHIHLVKRIVQYMMPKYNRFNEYSDLVSSGIIGLIDAVERFDLTHEVKFETYATTRIRGEVLDYIRSQDWAPSSLRKKISAIKITSESLENKNGEPPTDQQVADELDISVQQLQKIMSYTNVFNIMNYEDALSSDMIFAEITVPENETPENVLLEKDMKQILAAMIGELREKERLVIMLYYYEDHVIREVAEIMKVSESRVSQIHSNVLKKLRNKLQKIM